MGYFDLGSSRAFLKIARAFLIRNDVDTTATQTVHGNWNRIK